MAVSMETQRLISVSLGKIAQSRGQRGGINLHKNLLVATVLHKARTAYMMETYSYQQHLHRQKLLEQFQQNNLLNPIQKVSELNKGDVCPVSHDSNMGQASFICEQSRADVSSESATVPVTVEQMSVEDNDEVFLDKENSPPCNDNLIVESVNLSTTKLPTTSGPDSHLVAATQLSQEASCANISCKQQSLTCGSTTCNVLKRRRVNPNTSPQENDCPFTKVSRLSHESSVISISRSDNSDICHSSDSETTHSSDSETISHTSDSHQSGDTHQISSLVSILNSGFSGLCVTSSELEVTCQNSQSDFDYSNSQPARKIPTKAG